MSATDGPVLAFFDVDNTLMRGTSLFQLGREALDRGLITWRTLVPFAWQQFRFIRRGENDSHVASVRERALGLVGGVSHSALLELAEAIWEHRIRPRLFAQTVDLTRSHGELGHAVWLVSATPVEIGRVMARHLGLTGAIGTEVESVDGVYTGRLAGPVMHRDEKARAARELATAVGADLSQCWAYSDSRNDLPLLELVGNPVVVNPDAILAVHALRHNWPILLLTKTGVRAHRRRVKRWSRSLEPREGGAGGFPS